MNINIYGSTGEIGKTTLKLLENNFSEIKINLLCAKSNIQLLRKQIYKYKPKYAFLYDNEKKINIEKKIDKTKILNFKDLLIYLSSSKSTYSLLAISGYKSLYFLEHIIKNTDILGIASKEAIVSVGHIFNKKKYFNKTNIFPIDSEHYSLFDFFNKKNNRNVKNIILTASGGPFYKSKFKSLHNIKFSQAINHPKWKMGYKNSIDSATLVNKCLELIEAHYLFNIPFSKLNILVHPQAIVHSIVQYENFTTHFNLFKNDMKIPIINFLKYQNKLDIKIKNKNLYIENYNHLNFEKVKNDIFPVYNFFRNIDKEIPQNLIKFNIGNEFAVELFKNKIIKYTDIFKIIKKVTYLNLYSSVNTIKDIINYHEEIEAKIQGFNIYNL